MKITFGAQEILLACVLMIVISERFANFSREI